MRNNKRNSGDSNHILNTGLTYGTICDAIVMITTGGKGKHLNALEKYHICKISKDHLHMNEYSDTYNLIFEILQELYTR
jgi:hypothetical protein